MIYLITSRALTTPCRGPVPALGSQYRCLAWFYCPWRCSNRRYFVLPTHATLLRSTQQTLNDVEFVTRDDALISVLLLALFEALVFQGRQVPINWTTHVQGATALLETSGPEQFKSPLVYTCFCMRACASEGYVSPKASRSLAQSNYSRLPMKRSQKLGKGRGFEWEAFWMISLNYVRPRTACHCLSCCRNAAD